MTPVQIRLVQESFRLVVPIGEQAAVLFYSRLFQIDPATEALFAESDMKAQGRKLITAIAFVVHALGRPQTMLEAVQALARRHVGYGVEERHYETVGAALLWALAAGLDDAFTPAMRDAWAAAYTLLSTTMIEAARQEGFEKAA